MADAGEAESDVTELLSQIPSSLEAVVVEGDQSDSEAADESSPESVTTNPQQTLQIVSQVPWDPQSASDWTEKATPACINRITRDIMSVYAEPAPGICILPEKDDITKIHALITGPFDTPYEGGFFHFYIRCPPNYPLRPPRVKLLTTGGSRVRFNPNLYKNGKVCLSILGTWSGPSWSPAQTMSSVLISIQSLLNEKPYHNEPGFENERCAGDAERYNEVIRHETLRVAVCEPLQSEVRTHMPPEFREAIVRSFRDYYDYYQETCHKYRHLNGKQLALHDPFSENRRGSFDFAGLSERLRRIKESLPEVTSDESDVSDSETDEPPDEQT